MIIPSQNNLFMNELWFNLSDRVVPNVAPIFSISTWGRVFNRETKNILPKDIMYDKNHYITVRLKAIDNSPIHVQLHRITLLSFNYVDNSDSLEVNHKDGIKYHNWIWNLEWMSHIDNMNHAVENGLFRYGEDHSNSKLTNEQADEICRLISEGKTPTEIKEIVNIEYCNIPKIVQNIKLGYSWKNLAKKWQIGKCSSTIES